MSVWQLSGWQQVTVGIIGGIGLAFGVVIAVVSAWRAVRRWARALSPLGRRALGWDSAAAGVGCWRLHLLRRCLPRPVPSAASYLCPRSTRGGGLIRVCASTCRGTLEPRAASQRAAQARRREWSADGPMTRSYGRTCCGPPSSTACTGTPTAHRRGLGLRQRETIGQLAERAE